MALAPQRHAGTAEPRQAAMARRISARTQNHPAARRAGPGRHDPVRALCAAPRRDRRQRRARSAERTESAAGATRRRRRRSSRAARRRRPFDVHCPLGSLPLALQTEPDDCAGATSPICPPTKRGSPNGRRASARSRAHASPSPGRATPATTTTATGRWPSPGSRRCSPIPRRSREAERVSSAFNVMCAPRMRRRSLRNRA